MADAKQQALSQDKTTTTKLLSNALFEILPFLYLSTFSATERYDELKRLQITHIINLSNAKKETPTAKHLELFDVMYLPLPDEENYNIRTVLETCVFYIHKLQTNDSNNNSKIVVNCSAGKSRSASIVIGYCMVHKQMNLDEAYQYVLNIKPNIEPNLGFIQTLMDLEKNQLKLKESTFNFRAAQIHEIKKYLLKDSNRTDKEISHALDQCNGDHNKAAQLLMHSTDSN
eukprot:172797_1